MSENLRDLGRVKLVQVQPDGLIIKTPSGYFYDDSRLVEVERLKITSLGIEATTPEGEHVLYIHHIKYNMITNRYGHRWKSCMIWHRLCFRNRVTS